MTTDPATETHRAVFFDRDGTLIESVHYLNRPEQVRLIDGAANVLRECQQLGYLNVIVTNQAAIGKGLLTPEGLVEIQAELERQLADSNARIDAWYYCPLVRTVSSREVVEHPDRKPGPGMLLRAAREHAIDLRRSFMVGDMISDTLAGWNAGCAANILVGGESELASHPSVDYRIETLEELPALLRLRQAG